jgi:hypothetical protein
LKPPRTLSAVNQNMWGWMFVRVDDYFEAVEAIHLPLD